MENEIELTLDEENVYLPQILQEEKNRQLNEEKRQENNIKLTVAENERKENELKRLSNEEIRIENERQRQEKDEQRDEKITGIEDRLDANDEEIQAMQIDFQNLIKKKTYHFENIEAMKSCLTLIPGDVCQTLGYYSIKDGGNGIYNIRSKTSDDVEDKGSIHFLNNNLVAELITENNTVNVKQFGAKGDGETDNTIAIQNAFNFSKNINITDGTYMIDATVSLKPLSNSNIILSESAILKAIPNSNTNYDIIKISNISNVIIEGGVIEGERQQHNGTTGEWGMGISIRNNSSNITLRDIIIKDCWGDGLYINKVKNLKTQNIVCDNNRRQGISIISAENYYSLNDKLINTNGTSPQAGLDIEPNYSTDILKNIVFNNLYSKNNAGCGIQLYLPNLDNNSNISITFNNCIDDGSANSFSIGSLQNEAHGFITFNNCKSYNSLYSPFKIGAYNGLNCPLTLYKPCCYNGSTNSNSTIWGSMLTILNNNDINNNNIKIIEPYFLPADTTTSDNRYIYIQKGFNIYIINPLNHSRKIFIAQGQTNNIHFFDKYKQFEINNTFADNYSYTFGQNELISAFYNTSATKNVAHNISNIAPIGYKLTIYNNNVNNYSINLVFPEDNYCRKFSNMPGIIVKLKSIGDKLTLQKMNETEWQVTEIIGEPEIS